MSNKVNEEIKQLMNEMQTDLQNCINACDVLLDEVVVNG